MLCREVALYTLCALCTSVRRLHTTKCYYRILALESNEYKKKQRLDDEGEEIVDRSRSHRRDGRNRYDKSSNINNNTNTVDSDFRSNTTTRSYKRNTFTSGTERNNINNSMFGSSQQEKKEFFDSETNFCELCQETIEGSYRFHSEYIEHSARAGIYERAVTLIDKYLDHVMEVNNRPDRLLGKRSSTLSFNYTNSSNSASSHRMKLDHLFNFFDQSISFSRKRIRSEPSLLRSIDFVGILINYWWQSIHCPSAMEDLSHSMRYNVGSCASYIMETEKTSKQYNPRDRSFVEAGADENVTIVNFSRIPSLSSCNMNERKWRICYLLNFLRDHGILRNSLQIGTDNEPLIARQKTEHYQFVTFSLSERFERVELVGDEVMKAMSFDRLFRMFPFHECGGVNERLYLTLRLIDCNHGLLTIYDYLDLDRLLQIRLPNSKSKSDVVESIFGELHSWLNASEIACGVSRFEVDPSPEFRYLRAVVKHTLSELAHVIVMWEVEQTLCNARSFIESHVIHSPILRSATRAACSNVPEEERDRGPRDVLPLMTTVERKEPSIKNIGSSAWVAAKQLSETYKAKMVPFEHALNCLNCSSEISATGNEVQHTLLPHSISLSIPYVLPVVNNVNTYEREARKLFEKEGLMLFEEKNEERKELCKKEESGKDCCTYNVNDITSQSSSSESSSESSLITDTCANSSNNNSKQNSYSMFPDEFVNKEHECAKSSIGALRYSKWKESEINDIKRKVTRNVLRSLHSSQREVKEQLCNSLSSLSSSMPNKITILMPDFTQTKEEQFMEFIINTRK